MGITSSLKEDTSEEGNEFMHEPRSMYSRPYRWTRPHPVSPGPTNDESGPSYSHGINCYFIILYCVTDYHYNYIIEKLYVINQYIFQNRINLKIFYEYIEYFFVLKQLKVILYPFCF